MEIEFKAVKQYLHCIFTGTWNLQELTAGIKNVLTTCRYGLHENVLLDYQQVMGTLGAVERVLWAHEVVILYDQHLEFPGRHIRFAFLGSASSVLQGYHPGLEVLKANGLSAIVTADPEEAIGYLLVA